MRWEGGRFYWGSKTGEAGIVVVFAWVSSHERHLQPYIQLYSSFGWRSLVCHADFLTMFFPEKAALLADGVLKELVQELNARRLPVVFVAFSGGPRGCMYKILQLIQGKTEGHLNLDDYHLVKDSICGQIYDSSPVDSTIDSGIKFLLHPTVIGISHPPRVAAWMARAVLSGLDTLFASRFEAQRTDFWQTLYSSVNLGPFLILCSEDDELAAFPVISNFVQRLHELGGDVKLIKWNSSPHVDHYKHHSAEYKTAVTELLAKAKIIYSQRRQQFHGEKVGMGVDPRIPESVCSLHNAAASSNESLKRVAIDPSDFLPISMERDETRDACSTQRDENSKLFQMQNVPAINAHGVLGQLLFDVCVPKNIEGWDIKPSMSFNGRQTFTSARRHSPFNPMKCIRRSKL